MVKIEAIAVDVDGTITDGRRRVCHSALDALRKAEDAGIKLIDDEGTVDEVLARYINHINFMNNCPVLFGIFEF